MTDEEWLELLRDAFKGRWHIWHDEARGWCALPRNHPADPIVAATPHRLVDDLARADQARADSP